MKGKPTKEKRETEHYYCGHVAKIILKGKPTKEKRETEHYYCGHVAKIILKGKPTKEKRETILLFWSCSQNNLER